MAEKKDRSAEVEDVEIEVPVDNHTHQGKACARGDKIMVSPQTAEWLRKIWKVQG